MTTDTNAADEKGGEGSIDPKPKRCDHKFVDSKRCLKCGWQPFCGDTKLSHAGCCEPDPNLKAGKDGV